MHLFSLFPLAATRYICLRKIIAFMNSTTEVTITARRRHSIFLCTIITLVIYNLFIRRFFSNFMVALWNMAKVFNYRNQNIRQPNIFSSNAAWTLNCTADRENTEINHKRHQQSNNNPDYHCSHRSSKTMRSPPRDFEVPPPTFGRGCCSRSRAGNPPKCYWGTSSFSALPQIYQQTLIMLAALQRDLASK